MPAESKTAIEVQNISKVFRIPHEKHATLKSAALNIFSKRSYTEFQALKDISFEVKRGEFFGIIGRNGSGKSTLLKIMAGIYVPQSGTVKSYGKISPFLELGVGFNPELSGRENVFLGGAILGLTRKEISEKYEQIVDFSDLQEFMDMKLKNYSSGMQVRLAFSLAINAYADILLMDEVLAVGDANFQLKCVNEFLKYKEQGKTVILVTHDLLSVLKYCDRVLFLNDGITRGIGEPRKMIYEYELVNAEYADSSRGQTEPGTEGTQSENRWGTQDVIINNVEILGSNKSPKAAFQSSEGMIVRIHYTNKMEIDKAMFGIEIFNAERYRLFGVHSGMLDREIHLKKSGHIDFVIDSMPLADGRYYLCPAVANEKGNVQYDYRKDFRAFTVVNAGNEKSFFGDVNMGIEINA